MERQQCAKSSDTRVSDGETRRLSASLQPPRLAQQLPWGERVRFGALGGGRGLLLGGLDVSCYAGKASLDYNAKAMYECIH